ncbi:tRNA pseudouridine(13) synthase TruD [archaeon]|jgi:tRNA pseudouridine13 synthase|nr:tRNA pseudouridine(13) synthase TruD [archaeon]MBT3451553.1 tRNA pseudouridine(13) synthase TruD [archaeon]MBT6869412.1 tRNA pseudouridine(13) synthase TruD [archaeon]MBT7192575.1 tRNA pseudouridine(13) synthase TruD [archaeon]MBT7380651.1 tRNA pseudouridine(13) synthase TruD [archaeon]
MYNLKQIPGDFIVKEVKKLDLKESGKYAYVKITKNGFNTLDIVNKLSKLLHINKKQIGFAGNKDKNAVTEQYFSLENVGQNKILSLDLGNNIDIEFLGFCNEKISLGDLEGNKFEIVIRNLDGNIKLFKVKYFPNYFDEQRFSKNNVEIGRDLINKDFKLAVEKINSFICEEHLKEHLNDYVVALKKLSLKLLKIYVHAYQSYLWNKILADYLDNNCDINRKIKYSQGEFVFVNYPDQFLCLELPLIGFHTDDWKGNQEIKLLINKVMRKEKLDYEDFIIKQIPELSAEGDIRKAIVETKNLVLGKIEEDDLNPDMKKVKVSFELNKGSYATMAIRAIVGN